MRKRRIIARRRTKETFYEWEQGWHLAMARINGAPTLVERQPFFQDCLWVLNGAFADGDRLRFELGVRAECQGITKLPDFQVCRLKAAYTPS